MITTKFYARFFPFFNLITLNISVNKWSHREQARTVKTYILEELCFLYAQGLPYASFPGVLNIKRVLLKTRSHSYTELGSMQHPTK